MKMLALRFLGSRLVSITRAPSVFSNAFGVLDSHLVGDASLPLPTLAFGFPGSRLVGVYASGFANPRDAGDSRERY